MEYLINTGTAIICISLLAIFVVLTMSLHFEKVQRRLRNRKQRDTNTKNITLLTARMEKVEQQVEELTKQISK
jgi:uncharacterized membrane protein YhiD involved in acid resistance